MQPCRLNTRHHIKMKLLSNNRPLLRYGSNSCSGTGRNSENFKGNKTRRCSESWPWNGGKCPATTAAISTCKEPQTLGVLRRAMAQAVSFQPVTAQAWVRSQVCVKFVVGKVAVGQVCFRVLPIFSCQHHSTHVRTILAFIYMLFLTELQTDEV